MSNYDVSIFINCPFDSEYEYLFHALVFAVHDCGFIARSALEVGDVSRGRIEKIFDLVEECRFGIHDISRTEPDSISKLPRFNMPLELGIFLAAKHFEKQKKKSSLIMEREEHLCQKYCSDLKGFDIPAHNGDAQTAVTLVRNWLLSETVDQDLVKESREKDWPLPDGSKLFNRYATFLQGLPDLREKRGLGSQKLIFVDHRSCCIDWLRNNPR